MIELVGVAGVGKTTLANALNKSSKRIKLTDHPYFRKPGDIPFFAWNTLLMLPIFIRIFGKFGIKAISLREAAWMVILNGWHRALRRRTNNHHSILVMDQGPVSIMAELYYLDPERKRARYLKKWWERIIKSWRGSLDLLVWLDTADNALIERVRAREKWHLIKYKEKQEAVEFNFIYRSIYSNLLKELTAETPCPKIVPFNSGNETVEELKQKVLIEIGLIPSKIQPEPIA